MFAAETEHIADAYKNRFFDEKKRLFHQRTYAVLWVGIILIPLFSFLDLIVVPEFYQTFLVYRLVCALLFIFLMEIHRTKWAQENPLLLSILMYILASGLISIMAVRMGGYTSQYYIGIILVLVTCSVILPLSTIESVFMALLTYLIYVIPVLVCSIPTIESLKIFYGNNFFFWSFMLITVLQCFQENQLRAKRFNMKIQLEYFAGNLQKEVEKRAKKLKESEIRYRELYENIADMVVLINHQGKIIMANKPFYEMTGIPERSSTEPFLIEIIHPLDVDKVRGNLLESMPTKQFIRDLSFKIINDEGNIFDVECNVTHIKRQFKHIGYQMVIRDVTKRKELERNLYESTKNLQDARASTILGLAKLSEYRDRGTGDHLERIREYARIIATELSNHPRYERYINDEYIENIYRSSILHDIGKVGIPDAILCKPGKLSPDEFEIIKCHTQFGGDILKAVEANIKGKSFLTMGKEIAYYHHEKYDGTGYPFGLKGDQIPLSTRLVALADVYDALTSKRPYKIAYTHETARSILLNEKGKHFDPDVVDAFFENEQAFKKVRNMIFREHN